MGVTFPGQILAYFSNITRPQPSKVKSVYRTIISQDLTFGLVLRSRTTHVCQPIEKARKEEQADESGFLYDADPSSRKGLAALAEGRPRGLPAGRRTRIYRGLCR